MVDVMVDVDVEPVAPQLVMGASHVVVHDFPSARLFSAPRVVVAVTAHSTLHSLAVRIEQEADVDRSVSLDVGLSEAGEDFGSPSGSTSLSASTMGFKVFSKLLTTSSVSFTPLVTSVLNFCAVSMTHATSENAVLKSPPNRLLTSKSEAKISSLCPRSARLQGSGPCGGFGSL